jgi:LysM repeat protein
MRDNGLSAITQADTARHMNSANQSLRLLRSIILILIAAVSLNVVHAQSSDPGASLFRYRCGSGSISFFREAAFVFEVRHETIARPLLTAILSGVNQPVVIQSRASLWALHSNELQIHIDSDPSGTRLVLPASICGAIDLSGFEANDTTRTSSRASQAVAYVHLEGPGRGVAVAQVLPDGSVTAYAQLSGTGRAFAFAQSFTNPSPPPDGARYHTVQPGENLFRIALRYGTSYHTLATINNIHNPNLVYVGQRIYLPSA